MSRLSAIICLLSLCLSSTGAAEERYDREAALAASQAVIGSDLNTYTLRDVEGQPFDLASLRGKPLVVSLIYTSCYHVCPLITRNLAETVGIARDALGDDAFSVITVGFDWAVDTPNRMRIYAAEQGIDVPGWYFLAGDAATVTSLSQNLGFQFFASAKGYDHLSQTTVVDAGGKIYRQVYGQELDPPFLVEPLKELIFDSPREAGFVEHWVDTFKLFCTVYDPSSGRYSFDYSIFMTILTGILCLGAVAVFIVKEWRQAR